ncbi:ATP-binding protein [Rhizobium lentis]|uniref:AAA family ATPase n=1 Tax=Rhizobium lentis TaxID=1138194 RepID=UPI001C8399C5|nr:ATP-binding protein [Rhizobium lentis]
MDYPKYGLVLIDEVETSLHPRAQRRLMRDLTDSARTRGTNNSFHTFALHFGRTSARCPDLSHGRYRRHNSRHGGQS